MNNKSKARKVKEEFFKSLGGVKGSLSTVKNFSIETAPFFVKSLFTIIIVLGEAIIALIPATFMGFLVYTMLTSGLLFGLILLIIVVLLYFLIFAIYKVYGEKTKENWYAEFVRIATWYTTILAPIIALCMFMMDNMVNPESFLGFLVALLSFLALFPLLGIPPLIHTNLEQEY